MCTHCLRPPILRHYVYFANTFLHKDMNYTSNQCSPKFRSPVLQRNRQKTQVARVNVPESLEIRRRRGEARTYLKWGFINIVILALVSFDIWQTCVSAKDRFWYQAEYTFAVFIFLSVLACFGKYLCWLIVDNGQICVTELQRCLLDETNENSFRTVSPMSKPRIYKPESNIIDNVPIINWHSSFEDSRWGTPQSPRRSLSPTRSPQQPPPQHQQFNNQSYNCSMSGNNSSLNASNVSNDSTYMSPYAEVCREDFPTDVRELPALVRRIRRERRRSYDELADAAIMKSRNSTNSFWNYCNNAAAYMLKRTVYQLAPAPVVSTENAPSIEEFGIVEFKDSNSDVIKRISTVKLSQYLSNLRYWISTTILQRLVKQIDHMDEVFRQRGLSDWKIGTVSLERLRKMAENQQFVQSCAPMLPLLLPFLDTFNNQEYLVQRIKELSQGSCIGEYRWNSGNVHNGKEWGEHLPTDAAILFHVFCVYLDSQLMPLPQGGGRPFHSRYVLIRQEKRSTKDLVNAVNNKAHCAILVTNNQLKPKFNFISDKELHNCAHDRNNLFYVIIQFLIYMRTHQEAALEGVNLGKSGINIMCVIED
ncbi:transmembrane protein 209 [Drosophila grimshawi]|uniref:transmembrane protein 209 n=1 Tax=Drosophila grimshawi TaxID=7222 RepID=UPI0013EF254B|nr:transmembrane protein 209 [Drosophila grimshawi]